MTIDGYSKLVFIDLESTGARPMLDAITEIGVVEVCGEEVTRWSTLVNPEVPIPPFVQKLTGITDDMVREAPLFRDLLADVRARLEGALFIAHNARFDYGFLRSAFKRCGETFRSDVLDTIKLSRKFFPGEARHSLDALIERHSLPVDARHRALADADALWQFWRKLQDIIEPDVFHAAVHELMHKPKLLPHLDPDVLDDVPDGPGVYVFYGECDVPLYVGRATQLRPRVLTHLHAESPTQKNALLSRETHRIEWHETAGEVGAQLIEARLVRELRPLHVPAHSKPQDAWSWQVRSTAPLAAMVNSAADDFGADDDLYGLFSTRDKADMALHALADKHRLCLGTLGIDDAASHRCPHCAEPCAMQRQRLEQALHALKLKRWPYDGPACVAENGKNGRCDIHVAVNWRYLGTARTIQELRTAAASAPRRPVFDPDSYKTITHAVALGKVRLLSLAECERLLPQASV